MITIKEFKEENHTDLYLSLTYYSDDYKDILKLKNLNENQCELIKNSIDRINPTLQYDNDFAEISEIYDFVIKPLEEKLKKLSTKE